MAWRVGRSKIPFVFFEISTFREILLRARSTESWAKGAGECPKALNWDLSKETYASMLACESLFPLGIL